MRFNILPLPISLAIVVATWGAIAVWLSGYAPRLDRTLHRDLGRAMAQETLKVLGPGGSVTVFARDTATFPQPAMDIAVDAFEREIRRAGFVIKPIKTLQEDPLRPPQVPPGDFHEALRRAASGDVLVSFMGPPVLLEEQRATLVAIKAKIVALCTGPMETQALLRVLGEQGLLTTAIIPRPSVRTGLASRTFEDLYVRLSGPSWGAASTSGTR